MIKGSDLVLEGTVSGSPPFEITFLLNDKLSRDRGHNISVDNNTISLHVPNCESRDAGTYLCLVSNRVGETSCSFQVSLKGQSAEVLSASCPSAHQNFSQNSLPSLWAPNSIHWRTSTKP